MVVLDALLLDVECLLYSRHTEPLAHNLHGAAGVVVEGAANASLELGVDGEGLEALGGKGARLAKALANRGLAGRDLVVAAVIVDVVHVKAAHELGGEGGPGVKKI